MTEWPEPRLLTDDELRVRALARAAGRTADSPVIPIVGGRRPESLAAGKSTITATPYIWTDPTTIPRRDWLYSRHLIRAFVSALIAPGGVGKTAYTIVQALSIVSGKNLLGDNPFGRRLRVWLWNLEDPAEELTRRIQAAAMHHQLTADDLGDRLFVDSGRDQRLVIATTTRDGAKIVRPLADSLVEEIKARGIDVLTIDPFVSCHEASENDNQAIDMIVKEWASIADRAGCAVQLVHHTRKNIANEIEITAESARGAKSLTDACRSVQVINRMTKDEGAKAGVDNYRLFFRAFSDKANLAPPVEKSDWYRMEGVELGNGDNVGVVVPWQWPDALEGMTANDLLKVQQAIDGKNLRQNVQAKDWVGHAIGVILGIDSTSAGGRARIGSMLKIWIASGALVASEMVDAKGKRRPIIEVGEWQE